MLQVYEEFFHIKKFNSTQTKLHNYINYLFPNNIIKAILDDYFRKTIDIYSFINNEKLHFEKSILIELKSDVLNDSLYMMIDINFARICINNLFKNKLALDNYYFELSETEKGILQFCIEDFFRVLSAKTNNESFKLIEIHFDENVIDQKLYSNFIYQINISAQVNIIKLLVPNNLNLPSLKNNNAIISDLFFNNCYWTYFYRAINHC
jgi:hypothetical protein